MYDSEYKTACQRWNVLANKDRDRFEEAEFVELDKAIEDHRWAKAHPYYVLTRRYKANGDCVKGRRHFKTRAAQQRFMWNTTAAVTAYN